MVNVETGEEFEAEISFKGNISNLDKENITVNFKSDDGEALWETVIYDQRN